MDNNGEEDGAENLLSIELAVRDEEVAVILGGEIVCYTAPRLQRCLVELPPNTARVVLDLAGVLFIDSSGLRVIVNAQKASNGGLWLRGLTPATKRLLEITGMLPHFKITD
jgi:anti-anti-sigma factor